MPDHINLDATGLDRFAIIEHFRGMYPELVNEIFPHIRAVAAEMDDPDLLSPPREYLESMTEQIIRRYTETDPRIAGRRDRHKHDRHKHDRHKKDRDPLHALIYALLIAELLRRRNCCY